MIRNTSLIFGKPCAAWLFSFFRRYALCRTRVRRRERPGEMQLPFLQSVSVYGRAPFYSVIGRVPANTLANRKRVCYNKL